MFLKKGEMGKKMASSLLAQANNWQTTPGNVIEDVPTLYGLEGIVSNILNIGMAIVGLVLLFMLIKGGFAYITSGGDKEQTAKAKSTLTYAIVGLLVAVGAWLIIRLIEEFTGLNLHIFQIPRR
jgi:hypothetical protein